MSKLIFDAHLDLSMNALEFNRDLTQPVRNIREREEGLMDKPDRGNGTVSLPEMRKGGVGICVATMIARYVKPDNHLPGWHSQEQAWAQTQGQLSWYRAMEEKGEMVQIRDIKGFQEHLEMWNETSGTAELPVGYILSLEGADSIINMKYLEKAYAEGLRAIGPAHYGPGVYAFGTDADEGSVLPVPLQKGEFPRGTGSTGGLSPKGRDLLREMEKLNIILDVTHLNDQCFWEGLDLFHGAVWASHNNCRSLVPGNRQFSDDQIKALIERGSVIGAAFDAWMLIPGWEVGKSTPQTTGVYLRHVADHIDHICQLAGNSFHAAIGTDLDGEFGKEQCPYDLDTIADLQALLVLLKNRGYSEEDVENIASGNLIRFIRHAWI